MVLISVLYAARWGYQRGRYYHRTIVASAAPDRTRS